MKKPRLLANPNVEISRRYGPRYNSLEIRAHITLVGQFTLSALDLVGAVDQEALLAAAEFRAFSGVMHEARKLLAEDGK